MLVKSDYWSVKYQCRDCTCWSTTGGTCIHNSTDTQRPPHCALVLGDSNQVAKQLLINSRETKVVGKRYTCPSPHIVRDFGKEEPSVHLIYPTEQQAPTHTYIFTRIAGNIQSNDQLQEHRAFLQIHSFSPSTI